MNITETGKGFRGNGCPTSAGGSRCGAKLLKKNARQAFKLLSKCSPGLRFYILLLLASFYIIIYWKSVEKTTSY